MTHFVTYDTRRNDPGMDEFLPIQVERALQLLGKKGNDLRFRLLAKPKFKNGKEKIGEMSVAVNMWEFEDSDWDKKMKRKNRASNSPLNYVIYRDEDKNNSSDFFQTVKDAKITSVLEELMRGVKVSAAD